MEPEIKIFMDNVDAWIKQIRKEFTNFSDLPSIVSEATDSIQHNYELILELKDQIEEIKHEVNALKLIHIITLKKQIERIKTPRKTELILNKEGCIDLLNQLLNNFGNKTLKEILEDYKKGISFELAVSSQNLKKLDEVLSYRPVK